MANYYDGILGGIGSLLAAGAVTAAITQPAVIIGFALVAVALIAHALFISPPIETDTSPSQKQTPTQQFAD